VLDRGIAVRQGPRFFRTDLPIILGTRSGVLSPRMLLAIEELVGDWRRLNERIDALSQEIETLARQDPAGERLMTVPGIGPLISSAMVAAIGNGSVFTKGRDFGAWLGLVPKQISTGDRTILGAISRLRNRYLRALFVQAAWVVLARIKDWDRYGLKAWTDAAKKEIAPQCAGDRHCRQACPHCVGGSQQGARIRMHEDARHCVPTRISVAPLGAVRAKPCGWPPRAASLDSPARGTPLQMQARTKEPASWHEQRNCTDKEGSDEIAHIPISRRGLREVQTRWRIGLQGACETW
jgi:hypothetical protein